jgi:hypothetical protein
MTISPRANNLRWAAAACLAAAAFSGAAIAQDAGTPGTQPAAALDDFPHADIGNGIVSAKVYLPGETEAYRGTRFDHAGVVLHITYKDQDYSQYWFDRFATDPKDATDYGRGVEHACCATSGPVEEFAPVGYDEAGADGRFLKIGVGILQRNGEAYNQFPTYPILNAGSRTTEKMPDGVRFIQDINGDASGYGYHYEKTVRLVPGQPQMVIEHELKNTGDKLIVTTVYNHNFLTLSPGNEHVAITAPFAMIAEKPLQPELAQLDGKTIRYVTAVPPGQTVTSPITGFGGSADDYDFKVENTVTGFGQRIRADQPVDRINFWSVNTVLGWEPYIAIVLKPGEVKRWTYTYDFYGPDNK